MDMIKKKDRRVENEGYMEDVMTRFYYGDLIRIEYLEKLFGNDKTEIEFGYKMGVLKDSLIEYGCILTAVIGQGYRILYPNEVANEVYRKYAKASLGRIGKGLKIMANIDRNMLTKEEKEQFESFEKIMSEMYRTNENTLLSAQALISDTKRKELGN